MEYVALSLIFCRMVISSMVSDGLERWIVKKAQNYRLGMILK
ncbi:hypothetical protein NEIFL0001_0969 [Neisseria flavescens SK114]|nr:hypothetical protein NEIFL0001_0969 [Neisseria flavescens SK114]